MELSREQQPNPEESPRLSGEPHQDILTPSSDGQVNYMKSGQAGNCLTQPAGTESGTTLPVRASTTGPEISIHELETEETARRPSSCFSMGRRSLSFDSLQQLPSEPHLQDDNHLDHYQVHQPSPKFWDPLWLRSPFLITYTCCLIVVGLVVLAIHFVSNNDDGLVSASYGGGMGEVYACRYLPTTGSYCLALHRYLQADA